MSAVEMPQRFGFVQRDVLGLIAFDFILRLLLARMMFVAFVVHIAGVHLDDVAADVARFRVPSHVVANFEFRAHG